jgi:hypothetical protein
LVVRPKEKSPLGRPRLTPCPRNVFSPSLPMPKLRNLSVCNFLQ